MYQAFGAPKAAPSMLKLLGPNSLSRNALNWGLSHGIRIVIIIVVAYVLARAGRKLLERLEHRLRTEDTEAGRSPQRSKTLTEVSRSVVTMTSSTIAAMLVLGELGLNLAPLVASASIVGVALGFGAQSLVRDFLTGFFVLFEDQYAIGDVIEVGSVAGTGGVTGTVERFTLRMTALRSDDGTLHNIANGQIQRVSNSSAGWARALVDVGVAHEADMGQVHEAFVTASIDLLADEDIAAYILEAPKVLGPQALSESQVTIRISIKTLPGRRATVARAYRTRVREVFERSRIPMSTPSSMLILQGDSRGAGSVATAFEGSGETTGSGSPNGNGRGRTSDEGDGTG